MLNEVKILFKEKLVVRKLSFQEQSLWQIIGTAIGFFYQSKLVGVIGFRVSELNILELTFLHNFYADLPFVARRLAKFWVSLVKATKKSCFSISYPKDYDIEKKRSWGLWYFKPYLKSCKSFDMVLSTKYILEV